MRFYAEWNSISDRISSLLDTGRFLVASLASRASGGGVLGVVRDLIKNADGAYSLVVGLNSRHREVLPPKAQLCLSEFINRYFGLFCSGDPTSLKQADDQAGYDRAMARLTMLASFQSEFSHLISDSEIFARNMVDRAFLHLQRSIAADQAVAARWQRAFEHGEAECERLGGLQLLAFGIYSFKALSAGERTDLILGAPLEITPEIENASDALVLTEWKKVKDAAHAQRKADEAFEQARLYGQGSLAGFELPSRRYLVLVSKDRLSPQPERVDGGVVYQIKHVAVRPSPPSRARRTRDA